MIQSTGGDDGKERNEFGIIDINFYIRRAIITRPLIYLYLNIKERKKRISIPSGMDLKSGNDEISQNTRTNHMLTIPQGSHV